MSLSFVVRQAGSVAQFILMSSSRQLAVWEQLTRGEVCLGEKEGISTNIVSGDDLPIMTSYDILDIVHAFRCLGYTVSRR